MLTIRKPIELKIQQPIQTIHEDMAERLTANYELMRMPIRKEELLHITSQPPEIYFAEGDQIQMFSNFKQENQQNLRLDVINNLVNRIMVAQTDNFSYQDTVYISSVLRRLGIRDEKTFMKQVFALQNEHKETKQLLQKYETNQILLQNLFAQQEAQRQAEGKSSSSPVSVTENRYYLHEEIFKRLETRKIYQDMRDFSRDTRHLSRQIFRAELSIGEQAAMVQNFHLHELRQKIMGIESPIYYYHNNQYEFLQENLEEMSQTLEEQISAAILLNLTDQSYSLRQQQIEENNHYWYSLAGALFQTAENTWRRYESNLIENKRVSNQMLQLMEEVSEVKRQEGDVIQHITEEYQILQQRFAGDAMQQQTILQQNHIEGKREEINLSGDIYHLTQEELQLQLLRQAEEGEEETAPEPVTAEQLQKQLEVFSQRNFENYRKLTEIEWQQPQRKEQKVDRKKAQQDALRALENPAEVLMEYLTTEIRDPVQEAQRQAEVQIYHLFSEETREIYRQFLQQNRSGETAFLQHIMEQPEEAELRQEVKETLHQVQQMEKLTELTTMQRELQFRQVDFVHKAEEQVISEELLETIRSRQQTTKKEEHTEERLLQQEQSTQTIVQDTVNRMQVNQIENIEELVQQSVRRQLGNLSERVYGKIEKKLAAERKRRGY